MGLDVTSPPFLGCTFSAIIGLFLISIYSSSLKSDTQTQDKNSFDNIVCIISGMILIIVSILVIKFIY
jgi:hypothetical protein